MCFRLVLVLLCSDVDSHVFIGVHESAFLPFVDLLEAAFFICSYELSIKSLHSPWCFLFSEEDAKVGASGGRAVPQQRLHSPGFVQVLEYLMDLKQYWKRSHGHPISSLSSCPLFHHIFRTLDRAGRPRRWGTSHIECVALVIDVASLRSTEELPEPASILVGHAETLLPLISLLGLYKDQTMPTASNYHTQHGRTPGLRPSFCRCLSPYGWGFSQSGNQKHHLSFYGFYPECTAPPKVFYLCIYCFDLFFFYLFFFFLVFCDLVLIEMHL